MKNKEIWLNLGCGISLSDGFINVDNFYDLKDLKKGQKTKKGFFQNARVTKETKFVKADICALPFKDNYADYIECNDVIEHMPMNKVLTALREMYRVLKPGHKLGLMTTNFDELARLWTQEIEGNKLDTEEDWNRMFVLSQVIYGNQAWEGEYHKTAFNPFIIGYYLKGAGFDIKNINITIHPTGTPYNIPHKAYGHLTFEGMAVLTEMMWVEATK